MAKDAKKVGPTRRSRAAEMLGGMRNIAEAIATGDAPPGSVVRTYDIPDPSAYTPEMVRAVRERFGVAQSFFAKMLGVSTILVGSWEQGKRVPNPIASRMLDAMAADPAAWLTLAKVTLPSEAVAGRNEGIVATYSRDREAFGATVHIRKRKDGTATLAAIRNKHTDSSVGSIRKSADAKTLAAPRRK